MKGNKYSPQVHTKKIQFQPLSQKTKRITLNLSSKKIQNNKTIYSRKQTQPHTTNPDKKLKFNPTKPTKLKNKKKLLLYGIAKFICFPKHRQQCLAALSNAIATVSFRVLNCFDEAFV